MRHLEHRHRELRDEARGPYHWAKGLIETQMLFCPDGPREIRCLDGPSRALDSICDGNPIVLYNTKQLQLWSRNCVNKVYFMQRHLCLKS